MELSKEVGIIYFISDEDTGGSGTRTWIKKTFVIDIPLDKKSKKLAFTIWGDKINELIGFDIGDKVEVWFDQDSKEYNGKWYTNLTCIKIIEIEKIQRDNKQVINNYTKPKEVINIDSNIEDFDIDDLDLPF